MVKAASGLKKFLINRLSKLNTIFHRDRDDSGQKVYLVEEEPKHPDSWEDMGDGRWIRHHNVPRRDPFTPSGAPGGPKLEELEDVRLTERKFPDGTDDRLEDRWRTDIHFTDDISLWRGRSIFFVKGTRELYRPVDQTHAPATKPTSPPRTAAGGKGRVRTIVEICSFTLAMTSAALGSATGNWQAITPISIEQGYDLLTDAGRKNAEAYLRREKPDLIVAEWMCDPFSSMQNINIAKGGLTAEKILEKRKALAKLIEWIARQERRQRTRNCHWLGEQPERCGSWDLSATQEMQRENWNTVFDV